MTIPKFALGCVQPDCTFRVNPTEEVRKARTHYDVEHPRIDGLGMQLLILCPEDDTTMIPGHHEQGELEGTYSCPDCMQTFTLNKNPLE